MGALEIGFRRWGLDSGDGDWIQEKGIGFKRRGLDSRERLKRRIP